MDRILFHRERLLLSRPSVRVEVTLPAAREIKARNERVQNTE